MLMLLLVLSAVAAPGTRPAPQLATQPATQPATPATGNGIEAHAPLGAAGVRVIEARVGKLTTGDGGDGRDPDEALLLVTIDIRNDGGRKIDYGTWRGDDPRIHATLRDEAGNELVARSVVGRMPEGAVSSDTIQPGTSIRDLLMFEVPTSRAKRLVLTLPPYLVDTEGAPLVIEIPAASVRGLAGSK